MNFYLKLEIKCDNKGPELCSWNILANFFAGFLLPTLLLPNNHFSFSVLFPHCHPILVDFVTGNTYSLSCENVADVSWKRDKTNWLHWQSLILTLAERGVFWQDRDLNAQILKLSTSRCMFKQKNKEPFGTKWRAWGVLSVGRGSCFGSETNAQQPVFCLSAPVPSPHLSNPMPLAYWENITPKGTHMCTNSKFYPCHMLVHLYH